MHIRKNFPHHVKFYCNKIILPNSLKYYTVISSLILMTHFYDTRAFPFGVFVDFPKYVINYIIINLMYPFISDHFLDYYR